MKSVQPEWCTKLTLQQQSVLFLAARGPDGVAKANPCKAIQVAYRGCVLVAARYGRMLAYGEKADTFMSLDVFADEHAWAAAVKAFFQHIDELPHHYVMHLMHGVQILGYKHPELKFRAKWEAFYQLMVEDMHLYPESEAEMDKRLGDWDRRYW
jgi:hypothetical protein